jgi:rare lipoprotein A
MHSNRQGEYDRIRPQGGRGFRAFQSLGSEYRRDSGKRDGGTCDVLERRSGSGSENAFLKGVANRGGQALGIRGLSGNAPQEFLSGFPCDCRLSGEPRLPSRPTWLLPCFLILLLSGSVLLSGCGHKATKAQVPSPPSLPQEKPAATPAAGTTSENEKIEVPADAKPIFVETGVASWYGAPYHNRRGSNGEIYDMNAMTAAHLTLPLGSIVRVTNLKTDHSAIVRITDRGPFVVGRVIDLSLAAAKALDVYLPGTAKVRLEVLQAPAPLDTGGRWAVQIGSIPGKKEAAELAEHLQKRYQTAQVLKFVSPAGGWWVRVRVQNDDRQRATLLARETETTEGSVFLVRLD